MELASKPAQQQPFYMSANHSVANVKSIGEFKTIQTTLKSTLHVRENSLDELESLFDPSKWKTKLPLIKRNLPQSFFKPPVNSLSRLQSRHPYLKSLHLNHVRQISNIDSSMSNPSSNASNCNGLYSNGFGGNGGANANQLPVANYLSNTTNISLNSNHLRSMSEPVNMFPYSNGIDQQQLMLNTTNNSSNLPYGWQSALTNDGKLYYVKYASFC
jgi:hypothetical protein